jgi:N-acetylglucosaminyl-diphospho-decaprenol L-rhamnosyltransferase
VSTHRSDVAVVIVEHNTCDHLMTCLASLYAGGGLAGVSSAVWVVDNASTDGAMAILRRRHPQVRALAFDDNVGYAAANNRAMCDAGFGETGRINPGFRHLLLLNPDTIVPPRAVAGLVAAIEAESDVGVVGPKLLLLDGSLDLACRRSFPTVAVSFYRFCGLSRLFPGSPRFGRYNLTYLDPERDADVDSVVGACMLVRGEAIAQVGLLDERFWMYGEDLDWSLRMRACGWRTVYRPQVIVHHVKRAASRSSPRARYEFQRAMWLFYDKHYASTTPRGVDVLVKLALAARGGLRLWREMTASSGALA